MSLQKSNVLCSLYLFSLSIYLSTLTPTIYWGDSAEFSATSYLLDISHQPGYPLYNLISKLFTFLPAGCVAARCNFVSCFFASLTSVIIYLIFIELFNLLKYKNNLLAIPGTFLYLFSYTFWNQTAFAEAYTLFVFITSLLILLLLYLRGNNSDIRAFYLFVLLCGISITHHLLILPLGSAFLFFVIVNDKLRVELFRKLPLLIFLFILPLTIYLYLPLRSAQDPYLDWGNPEIFSQFKYTITLKSPDTDLEIYHPFLKSIWQEIRNVHTLSSNLSRIIFILPIITGFLLILGFIRENVKKYVMWIIYFLLISSFIFSYFFIVRFVPFFERVQGVHNTMFIELLIREFPSYIVWLAILGILFFLRYDKNLFLFFTFLFFISTVFVILRVFPTYKPYDHYRFFIIGNLILTIFITLGVANVKLILDKFKSKYFSLLPLFFFVSALFFVFMNNYKIINKRNYYYAEDLIKNINSTVPHHSLILIDGVDIYFLLYYYFKVNNINDKKLIFLDGVKVGWYFEKINKENFLKNTSAEKERIKDIVNLNYKKYKLYYAATGSSSREEVEKFCLKPKGVVYLVEKDKPCKFTEDNIKENKKYIYSIYKYRGIKNKTKDRKATGVVNLYGVMHQNLARMYLDFNKTNLAISEFKKSIELFPQNSSNYEILAGIYYNRRDISLTIKNLEEAVKYDKDNVYLMNRLGILYINTRDLTKAENIFSKCIKIYPEFLEGHYNLGVVYQMQGKIDKAIKQFKIAKKIAPNNFVPYLTLGEIYYKIGDMENAKKHFEEVLKISPGQEVAKKYLEEISK